MAQLESSPRHFLFQRIEEQSRASRSINCFSILRHAQLGFQCFFMVPKWGMWHFDPQFSFRVFSHWCYQRSLSHPPIRKHSTIFCNSKTQDRSFRMHNNFWHISAARTATLSQSAETRKSVIWLRYLLPARAKENTQKTTSQTEPKLCNTKPDRTGYNQQRASVACTQRNDAHLVRQVVRRHFLRFERRARRRRRSSELSARRLAPGVDLAVIGGGHSERSAAADELEPGRF